MEKVIATIVIIVLTLGLISYAVIGQMEDFGILRILSMKNRAD